MDRLEEEREKISEIDRKMAELFLRRMESVREIALYKQERGLPVYDPAREQQIIARNGSLIDDELLRGYYLSFYENILGVSKKYQHRLNEGIRVAYSGVQGAFADIAARKIFPGAEFVGFDGFEDAYRSVANGQFDCAVLPLENSYAGEVGQVMDLMFFGNLYVNGIYTLPVSHSLLAVRGSEIGGIRRVMSHPQALSQCREYIRRHGWEEIPAGNTAEAAQKVSELDDHETAAIASTLTASLYGLEILDHDINSSNTNTTKFAVFSKTGHRPEGSQTCKFILMFTVRDVAGALAKAVNVIGSHGFNLKALRSRPVPDKDWQYYFYAEAEGDDGSDAGIRMLSELKSQCDMLKIVGRFINEISIKEDLM